MIASLHTPFEPNFEKHFTWGLCVINASGTQLWVFYKGGGLVKRKILEAERQELLGSVLALSLAVWPQTSTCPSLGMSFPRSAVFKPGGRAPES